MSQCEGAVHQECAAGVSFCHFSLFLSISPSWTLSRSSKSNVKHRAFTWVNIASASSVLHSPSSYRKGVAPSSWHRISGSSASPEIITFVEGPWCITVAAHIALHSEYFNTVSIYRVCKTRVCRECLCSALKSRRVLVEKAFLSSRAMYIDVPLYALSSCHLVNPPVAIKCVDPCRACEFFNVLSIYHAEHVFREYRDTDHPYLNISVINDNLNFLRDILLECQQTTWITRSWLAHGTNLSNRKIKILLL